MMAQVEPVVAALAAGDPNLAADLTATIALGDGAPGVGEARGDHPQTAAKRADQGLVKARLPRRHGAAQGRRGRRAADTLRHAHAPTPAPAPTPRAGPRAGPDAPGEVAPRVVPRPPRGGASPAPPRRS